MWRPQFDETDICLVATSFYSNLSVAMTLHQKLRIDIKSALSSQGRPPVSQVTKLVSCQIWVFSSVMTWHCSPPPPPPPPIHCPQSCWWLNAEKTRYASNINCHIEAETRQNGSHFADDIFTCIFVKKNSCSINNIPALVQIMACQAKTYTCIEKQELSLCLYFRHSWHRRLSLWQPVMRTEITHTKTNTHVYWLLINS